MAGFLLASKKRFRLDTERLLLRLPEHTDFRMWAALRESSASFLVPWEPTWSDDHLSRRAFTGRVQWAARVRQQGTGLPLFLIRRDDSQLVGAITLDHIRRGPAQAGTVGYWIGQPFARHGYMREALRAVRVTRVEEVVFDPAEQAVVARLVDAEERARAKYILEAGGADDLVTVGEQRAPRTQWLSAQP